MESIPFALASFMQIDSICLFQFPCNRSVLVPSDSIDSLDSNTNTKLLHIYFQGSLITVILLTNKDRKVLIL